MIREKILKILDKAEFEVGFTTGYPELFGVRIKGESKEKLVSEIVNQIKQAKLDGMNEMPHIVKIENGKSNSDTAMVRQGEADVLLAEILEYFQKQFNESFLKKKHRAKLREWIPFLMRLLASKTA